MENKKEFSKSVLALVAIVLVAVLLLTGLNFITAPLIAENGSAAAFAPLYAVMPDAAGFDQLYDAADPDSSALANVPASVQSIYGETGGMGYVLRLSTSEGYTKQPIEFTLAIDAEGKISGVELTAYPETKDMGKETYPQTYLGQDSTLANVSLVAGVTYSSTAFKNAVADGFAALIDNGLIGAGVKGDEQILTEMLADVFPGIVNPTGTPQYEEQEIVCSYITKSLKALNDSGFALIMKNGDATYMAVCNAFGSVKLVDIDGNEVSDDAMAAEAKAYAEANIVSHSDGDLNKVKLLVPDASDVKAISLDGVYNSVTCAYKAEGVGYVFVSRSYGYSNEPMVIYYVIDDNGAIVTMTADELILFKEYFTSYQLDESSYKAGFTGLTGDSFTGDEALISGATVSSDAIRVATEDAFAAFAAVNENGGEIG